MKHLTSIVLAVAALALTACVTTNTTMLGGEFAGPALLPEEVKIYRTADQVPGPYTEVALLNSAGDSNYTNERNMYFSMRKEAAKIGANAIILDSLSEPGAGAKVAAAVFGVSAQRKGRAIAIRMDLPAAPTADPPPPPAATPAAGAIAEPASSPAPVRCGIVRQPNGSMKRVPC